MLKSLSIRRLHECVVHTIYNVCREPKVISQSVTRINKWLCTMCGKTLSVWGLWVQTKKNLVTTYTVKNNDRIKRRPRVARYTNQNMVKWSGKQGLIFLVLDLEEPNGYEYKFRPIETYTIEWMKSKVATTKLWWIEERKIMDSRVNVGKQKKKNSWWTNQTNLPVV